MDAATTHVAHPLALLTERLVAIQRADELWSAHAALSREAQPAGARLDGADVGHRRGLLIIKHFDALRIAPGRLVVAAADGGAVPYQRYAECMDDMEDLDLDAPAFVEGALAGLGVEVVAAGPRVLAFRAPADGMRVGDVARVVDAAARASDMPPPETLDVFLEPDKHAELVTAYVRDPFSAVPAGAAQAWRRLSRADFAAVGNTHDVHNFINLRRCDSTAVHA